MSIYPNGPNRSPSVEDIKSLAAGRWFDILIAASIPADRLDGRGHGCPKCGGNDRFAAFPNINMRGAVHCRQCFTRGTVPSPGDGIATLQWLLDLDFRATLGWLVDYLGCDSSQRTLFRRGHRRNVQATEATDDPASPDDSAIDFDTLAYDCFSRMTDSMIDGLATSLGVERRSLIRLRVGYAPKHRASTWPMVDSGGRCVGLRMRSLHGNKKFSYRGGRSGIFVPDGIPATTKRLYVCEGPTDTAAIISIGIDAIGRSSCNGNLATIVNFVRRLGCNDVVVVADNDGPGRSGAKQLASVLITVAECVRMIHPVEANSDIRDWVRAGHTSADFDEMVFEAPAMTLGVRRRVRTERRETER